MPSLRACAEPADVAGCTDAPRRRHRGDRRDEDFRSPMRRARRRPRGQTLFGMNVPSLERARRGGVGRGRRAAIVGTFADWEHAPDFPRAQAGDSIGAVPCR